MALERFSGNSSLVSLLADKLRTVLEHRDQSEWEYYNADRTKKIVIRKYPVEPHKYHEVSLQAKYLFKGWSEILAIKRRIVDGEARFTLEGDAVFDESHIWSSRMFVYSVDGNLIILDSFSRPRQDEELEAEKAQMRNLSCFNLQVLPKRIDFDTTAKRFFYQMVAGNFDQPKLIPYTEAPSVEGHTISPRLHR